MIYTPIVIKMSNNNNILSKAPALCPYCGVCIDSTFKDQSSSVSYNSSILILIAHYIRCCNKLFFTIHKLNKTENNSYTAELLLSYPQSILKKLPDSIHEISPRFAELHNQSYWAEQNNFLELAGTGYRNAMEVLIKDFAVTELGANYDDVKKLGLFEAIGNYIPDYKFQNAADVVRMLGNDYTHYERKYDNVGFEYIKIYLDLVITYVDAQYRLNHPPIPTRNHQNLS